MYELIDMYLNNAYMFLFLNICGLFFIGAIIYFIFILWKEIRVWK